MHGPCAPNREVYPSCSLKIISFFFFLSDVHDAVFLLSFVCVCRIARAARWRPNPSHHLHLNTALGAGVQTEGRAPTFFNFLFHYLASPLWKNSGTWVPEKVVTHTTPRRTLHLHFLDQVDAHWCEAKVNVTCAHEATFACKRSVCTKGDGAHAKDSSTKAARQDPDIICRSHVSHCQCISWFFVQVHTGSPAPGDP